MGDQVGISVMDYCQLVFEEIQSLTKRLYFLKDQRSLTKRPLPYWRKQAKRVITRGCIVPVFEHCLTIVHQISLRIRCLALKRACCCCCCCAEPFIAFRRLTSESVQGTSLTLQG